MAVSSFTLCVVLQSAVSSLSNKWIDEDCPRIRQPLHLLSAKEQLLYGEGLHAIRANGKYQIIVEAHSEHGEIHHGSSSFFYHSYYVWEVETQIRALGGDFECFSMPYYDYTVDARNERQPMILDSVFGGDGDAANLNCVLESDDAAAHFWDAAAWPLKETCDASEDGELGCCLKRKLNDEIELSDAVEVARILETPTFRVMSGAVGVEHLKVHQMIGGRGTDCTNCAMATEFSAADPIFMMLHSFTAYLRAVWAVCHGYDRIDARELEEHPDAYEAQCIPGWEDECGVIDLDGVYEFEGLADVEWSLTSTRDVTPRAMWNFSDWNVAYDHGSFVLSSHIDELRSCDRKNIEQSEWFSRSHRKVEEVQRIMDAMEASKHGTSAEETACDEVSSSSSENGESDSLSWSAWTLLVASAVLGLALLIIAAMVGCKVCRFGASNDYRLLRNDVDFYGAHERERL